MVPALNNLVDDFEEAFQVHSNFARCFMLFLTCRSISSGNYQWLH